MKKPENIDEYIADFPRETQKILEQLRAAIKSAAPEADEVISYGMPAFRFNGMLVYFAGYKNHIGFYPTPSAIEYFKAALSMYKGAKGSVQFPLDKPLPLKLIDEIVRYRLKNNLEKAKAKKNKIMSK